MCGRYYIDDETSREMKQILDALEKKLCHEKSNMKTGEIHPSDNAPVLMAKGKSVEPALFKWGFLNFTNKGLIINARSETISTKRTFQNSLFTRRCVIPASGFYEWNSNKEKVYFTPQIESTMYMAGIYDILNNVPRFVVLTTAANSSICDVHDRMPLLLSADQLIPWMFDPTQLQPILSQVPYALNRKSDYEQQILQL